MPVMLAACVPFALATAASADDYGTKKQGEQQQQGQSAEMKPAESGQKQPTKTYSGQVLGVSGDNLVVLVDGAAVPFESHKDTLIAGKETGTFSSIKSNLEEHFKAGDMVSVLAGRDGKKNSAYSYELAPATAQGPGGEAMGAEERARAAEFQPQEITGKLIGVDGRELFVDHNGLALKIKAGDQTTINGAQVKDVGGDLKKLMKGDQVSARFTVKKMENEASAIWKGGEQQQQQQQKQPQLEQGQQKPEDMGQPQEAPKPIEEPAQPEPDQAPE